jgi:YggT family protein
MIALSHVLRGLAEVLDLGLTIYWWVLLAYAVTSWVSADPRNPIVRFLHSACDPPLRFVRRRLPTSLRHFPLDMAFLVLLALVVFGMWGIVPALRDYAMTLRQQAVGFGGGG